MTTETGQENVVAMNSFVGRSQYPMLAQVEGYWQALREGGDIPRRSQLDPRGIESALEHAFIIERIAPGVARIRLAGRHLNDLMGMEVRGMPMTAFFAPDARKEVSMRLEEMFQTPGILTCGITGERGIGKPVLEGRLLLLPLKSDLGDISRALGCLVTGPDIGRTPRRFDISAPHLRALHEVPRNEVGPRAPRDPRVVVPGFAEPAPPFAAPVRPVPSSVPTTPPPPPVPPRAEGPRGSHLRLVKNDD